MSGASETRTQTILWNLGSITAVILGAAVFMMLAWRAAAASRPDAERHAAEMLSESRALCEKWGLAAGTPPFIECLGDIQAVRDHQVERIRENDQPL